MLFSLEQVDAANEHFNEYGHVGFVDAYDPDLGPLAAAELHGLFRKCQVYGEGEQKATVAGFRPEPARPNLTGVLTAIGLEAEQLGYEVWPADRASRLQVIYMTPGAEGSLHRDSEEIVGVVGITTLRGSSHLYVEDGSDYPLEPGCVAFLDAERQLLHQGVAGLDGDRVGLAVARIR